MRSKFVKAWSVGIYIGESPFNMIEYSRNPIISAKDIKEIPAYFIADPFLVNHYGTMYIFFELLNTKTGKGEIGVSRSSDYKKWQFLGTVLNENYHISYPMVFEWDENYYMIPETMKDNSIRLYKAIDFPYEWMYVANILEGKQYRDSTIFYHDNIWWLYTTYDDKNLYLYYSDDFLNNEWMKHPASPLVNGRYARPGGRIIRYNNRIIRFSQDLFPVYGSRIVAFEVDLLSPEQYNEKMIEPIPFLGPTGKGWNKNRVHHVDCHELESGEWLVVADGFSNNINYSVNIAIHRILQKFRSILHF